MTGVRSRTHLLSAAAAAFSCTLAIAGCGGSDRGATPATAPAAAAPTTPSLPNIKALRATDTLPNDPDDPAVWVNRTDAAKSLVLGTVKVAAPDGGLAVFGLDGKLKQLIKGADRPNNVDVEYGLDLDATPTDIAVVTERLGRRLRVYTISRDGALRDMSSGQMPILAGAPDDQGAPMGVGLFKRPKDGAIFAIIAPKYGNKENYLWQYRLGDDGTGRVKATFVRRFGAFSGVGEIEAIAVDDELGYVYYADEGSGIHKYAADPDAPDAAKELALFATTGYQQDREGIGIYVMPGGRGYIVSVDQLPGESVFHIYRREGEPAHPHDHTKIVASFTGGADGTDGLDVSSAALGPDFPTGILVAMNSASRNFLMYRWSDIVPLIK
jgi:3-phytase